jgi:ATP-binding protein involved in chromosome partitioning
VRVATDYNVPLLGQLPLNPQIRKDADSGNPTVVSHPEHPLVERYRDLARRMAAILSTQPKNLSKGLPKIVVEK